MVEHRSRIQLKYMIYQYYVHVLSEDADVVAKPEGFSWRNRGVQYFSGVAPPSNIFRIAAFSSSSTHDSSIEPSNPSIGPIHIRITASPTRIHQTMAAENYEASIALIDEAHARDPNITVVNGHAVPYELHYAQKMSHYLSLRAPTASPILQVAIRAQHFRRWEVPRDSYPMTKAGYLNWRSFLKKRQADLASEICVGCNFTSEEAEEVARLIRKEDLKKNEETQILEDVACLVFLDDQFEAFEKEHDEEKIIGILRKTWGKMSERGHELALQIPMSESSKALIGKALAG
jgi:hypothetical protein